MSALNKVVVRQENLKKFHVMKQIGTGGQAKVYQIMSKREHEEEKAGASPHPDREGRVFAIKVIIKSQLVNREYFEQMQMVNEIRIQRSLRLCGNTIKLFKIYESERYLNLLLEF
jgi:serine/threonine protein kinase